MTDTNYKTFRHKTNGKTIIGELYHKKDISYSGWWIKGPVEFKGTIFIINRKFNIENYDVIGMDEEGLKQFALMVLKQ